MVTDDARITDAGACQIEAWQRVNRGSREHWAFPACNPTGNLEMTFGANDLPDAIGGRSSDFVLQGKTLLRPLTTNGYGVGFAAGMYLHSDPGPDEGRLSNAYFYVPLSVSWLDDRLVTHINAGAQENRDIRNHALTYGFGAEVKLAERIFLIAETFGDNHVRHSYHGGLRIWLKPNRVQIDATVGGQDGNFGPTRWWTIGLRLISPPFLK